MSQNYTSSITRKELILQAIKLPSPHYIKLSTEINIVTSHHLLPPLQVCGTKPTGPSETCLPLRSLFPSQVTLGPQRLWSSACFHQTHIHSSHAFELFKFITQNSKAPWTCFPVTQLHYEFVSSVDIFLLEKYPVFLLGCLLLC